MKQVVYQLVFRSSLCIALVALLGACSLTSVKTATASLASSSEKFVLRGMTSNSVGDPSFIVIATYNVQGAVSAEKIPLVITGPATWNDGKPFEKTLDAKDAWLDGDRWRLSFSPDFSLGSTDGSTATTPMMPGVYTATTKIAGKTYTSSVDISNIIPTPMVSVDSASSSKVDVSWQPIPGVKQYYAVLYNDLRTVAYPIFTEKTSVSFEDFKAPLDTTQNFSVSVNAVTEKVYDPIVGDIIPVNLMGSQTEVTNIF